MQFVAISENHNKVWFAEWASNKVAYLDTTVPIPLDLKLKNENDKATTTMTLDRSGPKSLDVIVERNNGSNNGNCSYSFLSLAEVELAITGMSDSGLVGVSYNVQPQRVNMEQNQTAESQIKLDVQEDNNNAKPGQYTLMARTSAIEKESQLAVSKLYPISVTLDISAPALKPTPSDRNEGDSSRSQEELQAMMSLRETVRYLALAVAAGLGAFIVYKKIKR